MGCGNSKLEVEETGQIYQTVRTKPNQDDESNSHRKSISSIASDGGFLKRVIGSNDIRNRRNNEEFNSYRKSISSIASEGGFLKSVIGSNEKEKRVERELEPSDHGGRRSVSLSPLKEYTMRFKQPHYIETLEKDVEIENNNNNNEVEKDIEEDFIKQSNVEDYSSIIFPSSPSFRVYCVNHNDYEKEYEDDDEEREENKSAKEGDKGKRGRRRGIREAIYRGGSAIGLRSVFVQRGGSLKSKNLLIRSQNSSSSVDTSKLIIPKPSS